jgi:hypothetical protein
MSLINIDDYASIFAGFDAPVSAFDCGEKCSPYNEGGVPFCCDTRYVVPSAYHGEWEYLQTNNDLWHIWRADSIEETKRLQKEIPQGQVLIECLGFTQCHRSFRALTCRAFPFFPYLSSRGEFIGLSYYWEYRDRCWVISNLQVVSFEYRRQFIATFDRIFDWMPEERTTFSYHSADMRRSFSKQRRRFALLHRDGLIYTINADTEEMRCIEPEKLPKYGVYRISAYLPFPDEL